ncbi:MAG: hypothetical protein K1X89_31645 [Myxococcaceae bacterium]|nr:hypothetical protein [Myxococcaceae bacterium]
MSEPSSRPLLRGTALLNALAAARLLHGEGLLERFADALTPAQRAQYRTGYLPGRWYDEEVQATLVRTIRAHHGDEALVRTGLALMRRHVGRAQRFLTRVSGPRRLVARSAGLWAYWRNTGRVVVEHNGPTSARVVVLDHPLTGSPGDALLHGASSAYLLFLAGARQLRFRCDARDPRCTVLSSFWGEDLAAGHDTFAVDALVAGLPAPAPGDALVRRRGDPPAPERSPPSWRPGSTAA